MGWPSSTNYFEAIQNPALCFHDPELRRGEAAANAMGLPILYAGNFAAVFQVICPGNQSWAVKCFTREVRGLQQRYQAVSAHLQKVKLPFMVDFQYLEQGIKLGDTWFAVLKMRWVEGMAMNELVANSVDKPYVLNRLSKLWVQLATFLRQAKIAHGDLQHGNVLLIPGSKEGNVLLKLIDYDGMYVPALAANRPGERGHPNYQHPQRLKEGTYHAEIDRFSHLAIYTSLRCLTVAGKSLWKPAYDNGENLLFKEEDFREPGRSALFRELWQLRDAEAHALVGHLALAAGAPLEKAPLLDRLVVRDKVRPLTAQEEGQVTALLGPGFKGTSSGSGSQRRVFPTGWLRSTAQFCWTRKRWLLAGLGGLLGVAAVVWLVLLLLPSGQGTTTPGLGIYNLPPAKIAAYSEQFRGPKPAPGWQYLWNKAGPIGNPGHYRPLVWTGKNYNSDGSPGVPRPAPGSYVNLDRNGGHPGQGTQQAKIDFYAIAAYTLQPGDGPGPFRIINSSITTRGSVEVLIHINQQPPLPPRAVKSGAANPTSFDFELGTLNPGDTVYVAIGPQGNDSSDGFSNFDFTLYRGTPPAAARGDEFDLYQSARARRASKAHSRKRRLVPLSSR